MRTLNISGVLPTTILENTAPWEWAGGVTLGEDPSIVRFVEVDGFAGNFFDAALDPRTGFISIRPSARLDFEWFTANNQATSLTLNLRFFLTDGTQAIGSQGFTVNLLNVDDTPPERVFFTSGGSVRAGVAGAEVGRLGVLDRDTTSGFTFTLSEDDAWQYQIVNGVLRLRPGISASLADGPQKSITVTVSDGRQESAFTLDFTILPGANLPQEPVNFLIQGERKFGLAWGGPQSPIPWVAPDAVAGFVPIWEIRSLTVASGLVRLEREDRTSLLFDKPRLIELGSGLVDFRQDGPAGTKWLITETVLNRAPTLLEISDYATRASMGLSPQQHIVEMLTMGEAGARFARMTNAQFVREMYANIVPWDPGLDVVNWHAGRIASGFQTREGLVWDLVNWRRDFNDYKQVMDKGLYISRGWVPQIGAILDVLGGWPLGDYIWEWVNALNAGQLTLRQLAKALGPNPRVADKWAGVSDQDFLNIAHQEFRGTPMPEPAMADWTQAMGAGFLDRLDFVGVLAETMTTGSPLHALPLGATFQAIW